jgi:hypothetical protein
LDKIKKNYRFDLCDKSGRSGEAGGSASGRLDSSASLCLESDSIQRRLISASAADCIARRSFCSRSQTFCKASAMRASLAR